MQPPDKELEISSIRDIAARVGCSHSSVSRVLRNQPKVGKELREKILKVIEEIGYKRNPMLSSLMATQNRRRLRKHLTANIAWINPHPNKNFWHEHSYNVGYYQGAKEQATKLGYGLEDIWAHQQGMTGKRLKDILDSRGVLGLILPMKPGILLKMHFEWSDYAVVCLGAYQEGQQEWHRVSHDSRHACEIVFNKLIDSGYRRIAIAIPARTHKNKDKIQQIEAFRRQTFNQADFFTHDQDRSATGAYLFCSQFLDKKNRIPPIIYDRDAKDYRETLKEDVAHYKPDAIICRDQELFPILQEMGLRVPEDIGLAHLHVGTDVEDWAGIIGQDYRVGASTVDLLTSLVERNEKGLPAYPKQIRVGGYWQDGKTCRTLI